MADSPAAPPSQRLDSWKAIAEYLRRDVGTVRRWEREVGLPVRRLPGGRGRSVFAYTSEIDAWLTTSQKGQASQADVAPDARARQASRRRLVLTRTLAAAFVVGMIGLVLWSRSARLTATDLRIAVSPDGVVAFDGRTTERWRYRFPVEYATGLPIMPEPWRVLTNPPAVYVATATRERHSDHRIESGSLLWLDPSGRLRRSFSFADAVSFQGTKYESPWAITSFAVDDTSGRRQIAVAAHHHLWSASLVTVLDDQWRRLGTFVHFGWIEDVRWLAPNRLLIAGYSNAHDGGMVALLDPTAPGSIEGQGPEPPGTAGYCETCGMARPLRMVVLPRSDLNRATASRFNRAVLQVTADRVVARTIEVPAGQEGQDGADAVYELTPSLDLISASFSTSYVAVRRALEAQGRLKPGSATNAKTDAPAEIQMWEPQTGWRTRKIR